ncbi:MAG: glycerophosphodiester phosphodiesterase [Inquilinaceae bacterium]
MPPSSWPYLDHPGPLAFAHRGGTEAAPENSMEAFAAAVALGYRYLETDVHATRDGVLVAFHDDTLDRVTDGAGALGDLDWADVRRARMANGEAPPLAEDLLGAWPHTRINIDPKTDAAAALLPDLIRRTDTLSRVCVGSFSDRRLARLRRALGPGLCTSMGPVAVARLRLTPVGPVLGGFDAACAQVPVARYGVRIVDRAFIAAAHRHGLQVHVWTIDDPAEMNRLLDLGVDGLMTDRPSALKQVLQARGAWSGG